MNTRSQTVRHRLSRRALCFILAVVLAIPSPLSLAPAKANIFSFDLKDERELGEKFNILVRSKLPMIEDSEVVDYVRSVVNRLAKVLPPQPFKFTTSVVKDNAVNAFAAPAGYVFVFTGLLLNMDHESEVAGVLAHEMAHVTQRHIAKQVEQSRVMNVASILGLLAGLALGTAAGQRDAGAAMMVGSQAATTQAMLNYSRTDEREADEVGMTYLVAAGYPPRGLPMAFEVLNRMRIFQGQGTIPTYLSTHPDITQRIGYLSERVARLPKDVVNRKDDDERFLRVQMLLRARFGPPEIAVAYYQKKGASLTKLDRLGMAVALGRTNDTAQARQAFQKALAENGEDSLWLREAGRFFLKVRDFDQARTYLRRAVEKNPRDMVATYEYAGILAQERDYARAIDLMRNVIRSTPEAPEVYQQFGRISGESGDLFHAYLYLAYAGVYANDPRQTRFQMGKARGLARTEEQRQELDRLEKVVKARSEFWPKGAMTGG